MAERGAMRARHLAWALALAVPLIMLCYFWANLHIGYRFGLGAKAPADLLAICNDASEQGGCVGARPGRAQLERHHQHRHRRGHRRSF